MVFRISVELNQIEKKIQQVHNVGIIIVFATTTLSEEPLTQRFIWKFLLYMFFGWAMDTNTVVMARGRGWGWVEVGKGVEDCGHLQECHQ